MMSKENLINYTDNYRPEFHYSCRSGWMNDPNGLIFFNGYYHLYYQHDPDRIVHDGFMHWGHARSKNLVDWEELPVALSPDEKGEIFSGCIVDDRDNTSGFGEGDLTPLVAVFTHNFESGTIKKQYQSLAFSLDGGISFTKYENNPVLDLGLQDFRDPKVFWDEKTKRWIMLVAALNTVRIFSSENLRAWTQESVFSTGDLAEDEIWECPDLVCMETEDGKKKWVLIVSQNTLDYRKTGVRYFIGEFDGSSFFPDTGISKKQFLDFGRDNYAAATFQKTENRNIQISWMDCWAYAQSTPEKGFRGIMTIPRELFLIGSKNEMKIGQRIAAEVTERLPEIQINSRRYDAGKLSGIYILPLKIKKGKILIGNTQERVDIKFDYEAGKIYVDRSRSGFIPGEEFFEIKEGDLRGETEKGFRIMIDTSSIEMFSLSGKTAGSFLYYAERPFQTIEVTEEV